MSNSVKVFYPRYSTQSLLKAIGDRIGALRGALPLKLVVLFGSYATGRYTVASDIDLLVVYRGKPRQDAFAIVNKVIKIPQLEPHVYSETEQSLMKDMLDRMTEGGKVVYEEPEQASS